MAWLRLDDRFANHPKVVGLSDREFRVWIRTLLYCAAYRTKGTIPDRSPIPGLTPKMLEKLRNVGLLDVIDGKNCVHDWAEYNPIDTDAATRMRRNREAIPRVSQGRWAKVREQVFERDQGVCAVCGDRDEDAFAKGLLSGWNADHEPSRAELTAQGLDIYDLAFIVTLCHSCHAKKTRREATASKTEPRPNLQPNQVEVGSPLARASAPVPVPSRPLPQPLGSGPRSAGVNSTAAGSSARAAAIDKEALDQADPVHRLLAVLRKPTTDTEDALRVFVGRVPESAFDFARDEIRVAKGVRNDGGLALTILRRIQGEQGGAANNGPTYTGCRLARGSHGTTHVSDPLGTEKPPRDWPHAWPSQQEIDAALAARERQSPPTPVVKR